MGRIRLFWRHRKTHQMAVAVERLNHILRVVDISSIAPTRTFDINLAIRVGWVIAPGEQPEHDIGIEIIHPGNQFEPIAAVPKCPRGYYLCALPLISPICNP